MGKLTYQFELIRAIRKFFNQQDFIDVLTPPMVQNPGMETHIHPFEVFRAKEKTSTGMYLHTSPEFQMKKLLASEEGFQNLFNISYVFRDEPKSSIHRNQFIMLEWYRKNAYYTKIMQDIEDLLLHLQRVFIKKGYPLRQKINSFPRATVQEIIQEYSRVDILDFLDTKDLKEKISKDFKQVPLPTSECSWDDYFFLFFLNVIEPHFKNYPYLLLYEFPAPLSALSTLKLEDPRVCERFEVYLSGVELCNCFNELTNFEQQTERFKEQSAQKKQLYGYELPWPKDFMQTMNNGLPKSSGIALGVERLLFSLIDLENPFFD